MGAHSMPRASRLAGGATTIKTTMTSAVVVAAIAGGIGAAAAAPEQGGTNPNDTAPQQGGTDPGDQAPQHGGATPRQGGTSPTPQSVEPAYVPGPGTIPAPPQEAPYQPYTSQQAAPDYQTVYNALPDEPLTSPKPVAPVRPIAPPPNKLRVGNYIAERPSYLSKNDVNSINAWSAYGEAKIAQGLISVGVPHDKASRQAASTIIGVMSGGTAGAAALGIPSAVVGAVAGAGVGAVVGAGVGAGVGAAAALPSGVGVPAAAVAAAGPGALIGAGVGAVAGAVGVGAAGGAVGAAIGGTIGGVGAYTLGAGDPGKDPRAPWLGDDTKPQNPEQPSQEPTGPNQFRATLPADQAKKAGLPAVDYIVDARGDVHAQTQIDGRTIAVNWDVDRAMAPYRLLGPAGEQLEQSVRQTTKRATDDLHKSAPDVKVTWAEPTASRPAQNPPAADFRSIH